MSRDWPENYSVEEHLYKITVALREIREELRQLNESWTKIGPKLVQNPGPRLTKPQK